SVEAVANGQQAFSKAFDAELAGFADFFVSAAAHVFCVGLGAQVLVGHFGVLGLELVELVLQTGHFVRHIGGHCSLNFFGRSIGGHGGLICILFRHVDSVSKE